MMMILHMCNLTITFSNSVIIILAKVGPKGEPIETPSVYL